MYQLEDLSELQSLEELIDLEDFDDDNIDDASDLDVFEDNTQPPSPSRLSIQQKNISATIAYYIGVRDNIIENNYSECTELIEKLKKDTNAVCIRSLCNIRSNLMLNYTNVVQQLNDFKNLDKQEIFQNDIEILKNNGLDVIKANCNINKYIENFNELISQKIDSIKDYIPNWVNLSYIKDLFKMPKNKKDYIKTTSIEYSTNRTFYPFNRYINLKLSTNNGNILANDLKFLKILYFKHNDHFNDISKVVDASDDIKFNIYNFIGNSNSVVMTVDCENSDPYKLLSVIYNLNYDEINKIKKIILFDDVNTIDAWKVIKNFIDIPVEYNLVKRVKSDKSLVDQNMIVSITKSFYAEKVESFILVSSDSDYWSVISGLPDAEFLVMIEDNKCSREIKNALIEHGTYFCSIDRFCTDNIDNYKKFVFTRELKRQVEKLFTIKADELLNAIYKSCKINATDAEKNSFYNKYLKNISFTTDANGKFILSLSDKK